MLAAIAELTAAVTHAHTSGTSFLSLQQRDAATVVAEWDFDLRDLDFALQFDRNEDGAVTWGEVAAAHGGIDALVLARTQLLQEEVPCAAQGAADLTLAEHGDGTYLRWQRAFRCPSDAPLTLNHAGWFEFDPGHRALLEYVAIDGGRVQSMLTRQAQQWRLAESRSDRLQRFFLEGMHHLITGYDHLAFLAVLLLALVRRTASAERVAQGLMLRSAAMRALGVITAFTLAHSLTLVLAATETVVLPSRPVEVAIAASVLLAASLNLAHAAAKHSWRLAFGFGLIHGLGFAGALAELTRERLDLWALAAFNIGIEAAQVAVAAIAVPCLWLLFRGRTGQRIGLPLASASLAAVAAFWVVVRL